MADLYAGDSDARQTQEDAPVGLFRTRYRKLDHSDVALHDAIKAKADELAALFAQIDTTTRGPLPPIGADIIGNMTMNRGAHVTLALRHLEDAVYRAVKALTA